MEGKSVTGTTQQGIQDWKRRKKARAVYDLFHSLQAIGESKRAQKLVGCERSFWLDSVSCGTYRLVPIRCDDLFCPRCANRRSKPLQKKVLSKLRRKDCDYWFLTVTLENVPAITRAFIRWLVAQFAELRETDVWKEYVLGGVYSLECTYNRERKDWHPHFHVLIETPKRLPRGWVFAIRLLWGLLVNPTRPLAHVNLTRAYGLDKKGRKTRRINMRSVRELVKYATKSADFAADPERVGEFIATFRHVRRIQSFGSFLNVERDAQEEVQKEEAQAEGAPDALVGCACGTCTNAMWKRHSESVHISETVKMPDGTRQLKLFDQVVFRGDSPPRGAPVVLDFDRDYQPMDIEPWNLTPERVALEKQLQRRLAYCDGFDVVAANVRLQRQEVAGLFGNAVS